MATHVALAALCFVCAITLGCFGIGINSEKTHVILKGFAGKTSYNLDEFKDGADHFWKGIAETLQIYALVNWYDENSSDDDSDDDGDYVQIRWPLQGN